MMDSQKIQAYNWGSMVSKMEKRLASAGSKVTFHRQDCLVSQDFVTNLVTFQRILIERSARNSAHLASFH